MNEILKTLNRFKNLLVGLAVAAILGYTGYQLHQIITVTPDQNYIDAQNQQTSASIIKIDSTAINGLKDLTNVPGQADLSNLGKGDPFSP